MKRFIRITIGAALAFSAQLCVSHAVQAATFVSLYSFCGSLTKTVCNDGSTPTSRLLQIGGAFYGATQSGGPSDNGTLYRVTAAGDFKSLYSFCTQSYCPDGANPGRYPALGPDGEIYGVTLRGGNSTDAGTVFKLSTSGELKTLHRFCAEKNCADGYQPAAVAFDKSGDMFGTTSAGGPYRYGTIFEITAGGGFKILHAFCRTENCSDGTLPGAPILGTDGNFYGTTRAGGAHQGGTVFEITPTGKFTTLYSFCAQKLCADGQEPNQILVEGRDGNFYGTTLLGGANAEGAIFQVTPSGTLKTLHSFCTQPYCDDGKSPQDGMTLAADGSFYGTAGAGGPFYGGLVFNITSAGAYKIVHSFCAEHGCFDGSAPAVSPIVGHDGKLYGSTQAGGDKYNVGAAYQLTP